MSGWGLIGLVAGLAFIALFLYWQIVIAEGVYLGQKAVTLLYDRVAHKYDRIKDFDSTDEHLFLAYPLNRALGAEFDGIILDVAAGTGRLPMAMSRFPPFRGTVISLDRSTRMLAVARRSQPHLPLVVADAMSLPFADDAIPAVTCLEALEFLPDPAGGLRELVRVLAPGGVLLATNRVGWEVRFMPGKTWTAEQLRAILDQMPLTDIVILPWLNIYDQVWAKKVVLELQLNHRPQIYGGF